MLSTKKIQKDSSKAENNTFLGDPPYKRFPSHAKYSRERERERARDNCFKHKRRINKSEKPTVGHLKNIKIRIICFIDSILGQHNITISSTDYHYIQVELSPFDQETNGKADS